MTTDFEALQIQWRDYFQKMAEQIVDIVRKNPGLLAAGPPVARVTDVRFNNGGVSFRVGAERYFYDGNWLGTAHRFHPSDIALIERCWAEGRLGEREVLADDGTVGTIVADREFFSIEVDGVLRASLQPYHLTDDDRDSWNWGCGFTFYDPTQRARVRAIVAGMQKERRPGEPPPGADSTQYDNAPPVTPSGEVKAPLDRFLDDLRAGIDKGRAKYPDPSGLMLGLTAEIGELANAIQRESQDRIWSEAIDVAVVAARVAIEGDPALDFIREKKGLSITPRDVAALSDHIRRGDVETLAREMLPKLGARLVMQGGQLHELDERLKTALCSVGVLRARINELESAAPDLTELREAWKDWTPGRGSRTLDGFNALLAAVERLVGK